MARKSTKALTTEEFIRRSKEVHGDKYDYSQTVYVRGGKMKIICPVHGPFWQGNSHYYKGCGCPKCGSETRSKKAIGNQYAKKVYYDVSNIKIPEHIHLDISDKIRTSATIYGMCEEHGPFQTKLKYVLNGEPCSYCRFPRVNTEEFIRRSKEVHGDKYDYSESFYIDHTSKVKIICTEHGEFWQSPREHFRGSGCRACASHGKSSIEEIVLGWFPFLKQSLRNILDGKEIDLYDETRKVGIEVNGTYWHSEDKVEIDYHKDKTKLAWSKGVSLLQFWEFEVLDKPEIVKSMIESKLGISSKIYARECKLIKVSTPEARRFEDENHIQGRCGASYNYGLWHKEHGLVSLMTFGMSRFTNRKYELIRFCSIRGFTVVGAASKLLAAFRKEHSGPIVSYANMRFSNGSVYEKLGFELVRETCPNYFWHKIYGGIIPRYKSKKRILSKLLGEAYIHAETEVENMTRNKYYRCFDCGNLVYEMKG